VKFSMAPPSNRVNRVAKLVVNPWTGPIDCCWSDCWNKARTIYPLRTHEHRPSVPCAWVDQAGGALGTHSHYTFCSEQHLRYFLLCSGMNAHETAARNQGKIYGMAGPGEKIGRLR
jgi:hypothetical protein